MSGLPTDGVSAYYGNNSERPPVTKVAGIWQEEIASLPVVYNHQ